MLHEGNLVQLYFSCLKLQYLARTDLAVISLSIILHDNMQTSALNNITCRRVILCADAWRQETDWWPKATRINPIAPCAQHSTPLASRLSTRQQTHDTLSATAFVPQLADRRTKITGRESESLSRFPSSHTVALEAIHASKLTDPNSKYD